MYDWIVLGLGWVVESSPYEFSYMNSLWRRYVGFITFLICLYVYLYIFIYTMSRVIVGRRCDSLNKYVKVSPETGTTKISKHNEKVSHNIQVTKVFPLRPYIILLTLINCIIPFTMWVIYMSMRSTSKTEAKSLSQFLRRHTHNKV